MRTPVDDLLVPLDAAAPAFVEVLDVLGRNLRRFTVAVEQPGRDQPERHVLLIRVAGLDILVGPDRSHAPSALPQFCPERHINSDDTFCLGLDRTVTGAVANAVDWWNRLYQFLLYQHLPVWPRDKALPHGKAADHWVEVENILAALPEAIRSKFGQHGALLAERRLRIWREGLLSVRLVNGRGHCVCGAGKVRRDCPYCIIAAKILDALLKEQEANRLFVAHQKKQGRTCCGTRTRCCMKD